MDLVADDEVPSRSELLTYVTEGRAFVAVELDDSPAAYLLIDVVDGRAHIEQVSVSPAHARLGIGRQLIDTAAEWAAANGFAALTLTTFVEVPWNGPYYERLGFRYLSSEEETPQLREIRRHEAAAGLDAWPRAAMIRSVAAARPYR